MILLIAVNVINNEATDVIDFTKDWKGGIAMWRAYGEQCEAEGDTYVHLVYDTELEVFL